jgi:hypothetical protein
MAALRKKIDGLGHECLVFCRNDPTYFAGSHAERKPDVVGVWESALRDDGAQNRASNADDSNKTPRRIFLDSHCWS